MATYQEIRRQVENLTLGEQMRLIEELKTIVSHCKQPQPKRSIMELEGLGKEIWQNISAQEYIDQERRSW